MTDWLYSTSWLKIYTKNERNLISKIITNNNSNSNNANKTAAWIRNEKKKQTNPWFLSNVLKFESNREQSSSLSSSTTTMMIMMSKCNGAHQKIEKKRENICVCTRLRDEWMELNIICIDVMIDFRDIWPLN